MVAWAIPVHTGHTLARLEAYVLAKPIITTLGLCVKYAAIDDRAMGKVPQETVSNIAHWLRQDLFGRDSWEKISLYTKWNGLKMCLEDECSPFDHWSANEIREKLEEFECESGMDWDQKPSTYLNPDTFHRNRIYDPSIYSCTPFDPKDSWLDNHEWRDSLDGESEDKLLLSRFQLLHLLGLRTGDRHSESVEKYNKVGPQKRRADQAVAKHNTNSL